MNVAALGRQASAGAIVGLSSVIYAISYGALMFAGPLSPFVGFAVTSTFIAAILGVLFGILSEEKTFIGGPDANTISVLATMLAALGALGLPEILSLHLALEVVFLTAVLCAVSFYVVGRLNLAELVRYIPFSVMAGFLASTGWLMVSGALNIVSGTPLTAAGLDALRTDPVRPELVFGGLVAASLFVLARRLSGAIVIPAVIVAASLVVNLFLVSGVCDLSYCRPEVWLFTQSQEAQWLPPWDLGWTVSRWDDLFRVLPAMLVVSFVGLLTILLSVASLELSYQKEFDLNRVLKTHGYTVGLSALLGGAIGLISIGRTTLNSKAGGGAFSGAIAAAICLAVLLGADEIVAYIPKAALGGLILYLGIAMLKQWVWDQRRAVSLSELIQIVSILALVANYGYLVGFAAGIVFSCVFFVINYSRIPLARLATDLSLFSSSVVRSDQQAGILKAHGQATRLYRLGGYVFFGSAKKIDDVFRRMNARAIDGVIVDFTSVSGIDKAALGAFQRILHRYRDTPIRFYFVSAKGNDASLRALSTDAVSRAQIEYFESLDHAVETAEERIILKYGERSVDSACFEFLEDCTERETFLSYCEFRQASRGETLCREGDRSNEVFFLESGSLDIIKSADDRAGLRLAKLHSGSIAGELAFYTGEARTASIVAAVDSRVYLLRGEALMRMRRHHPELATRFDHLVIRKIAHALARTTDLAAKLAG